MPDVPGSHGQKLLMPGPGQVREDGGVVLLCEHVCPVTRSTHLAGERSAGMKHFGGATTAVNLALDKYQKIACGIP